MANDRLFWTRFDGKRRRVKYLGHQHLSNILWFNEVFNGMKPYTDNTTYVLNQLQDEITKRYNGVRLKFKPLPIPDEVKGLYTLGLIDERKNIVLNGKIIGSIRHIK